jgi:hypothetical protein
MQRLINSSRSLTYDEISGKFLLQGTSKSREVRVVIAETHDCSS